MLDEILKDWTTAEREGFATALGRFNATIDGWEISGPPELGR
jgi:hypothetical protein